MKVSLRTEQVGFFLYENILGYLAVENPFRFVFFASLVTSVDKETHMYMYVSKCYKSVKPVCMTGYY